MRKSGIAVVLLGVLCSDRAWAGDLSGVSMAWARDWSGRELDTVMTLYAPHPVFLPTSGERWEGPVAIRRNLIKVMAQFMADLHLKSLASDASGILAYASGTYEETILPVKGGAALQFKGNYLFVVQRQKNGGWKILEQTFTAIGSEKL